MHSAKLWFFRSPVALKPSMGAVDENLFMVEHVPLDIMQANNGCVLSAAQTTLKLDEDWSLIIPTENRGGTKSHPAYLRKSTK